MDNLKDTGAGKTAGSQVSLQSLEHLTREIPELAPALEEIEARWPKEEYSPELLAHKFSAFVKKNMEPEEALSADSGSGRTDAKGSAGLGVYCRVPSPGAFSDKPEGRG